MLRKKQSAVSGRLFLRNNGSRPWPTIYPGHGESGSIELIDSQERYLFTYIDVLRELSGGNSTLTEEAKAELTQRMEEFLPGGGLSFLIAQSADSVAAELARAAAAAADG